MIETSEVEMISRRGVIRIVGLATLGLVATPTLLTVSDAEAQGFIAIPAQTPQTPETGTERRQERRTERTGQRQERRGKRQKGRTERRKKRRGTTAKPKTTAPSP
jgi:hypothetical protein